MQLDQAENLRSSDSDWRGLHRALALALAPLVALGFTRFAYALLLPGMQASLHWRLAEAGALNTANAAGFLIGALSASALAAHWGTARVFTVSLVLSALCLLATGWLDSWAAFMVLRALGGLSTACAFVLGSALAPRAMPARPGLALAIYFGGTGLGMMVAGLGWGLGQWLPSSQPWRAGWTFLGATALLAAAASGAAAWRMGKGAPPARHESPPPAQPLRRLIGPTLAANALYGAGYVGYTTFVVALLAQRGVGPTAGALVFFAIGAASVLATPSWGRWLERCRGGRGFALVSLLLALSLLPVLLFTHLAAVAASAMLFGAVFMAGPAAVSVVAQRSLRTGDLARGLGALTAAFSLGQSVGPLASGWLADATGLLESGLWLGPLLLMAGAVVSLAQKDVVGTSG